MRVQDLDDQERSRHVTNHADVLVVCSDGHFVRSLEVQLEVRGLVVSKHVDFSSALDSLRHVKPSVMIIEWNLHDLETVDFLVKVSEDLSWGEMSVFFICDHRLDESEVIMMQSLGSEFTFERSALEDPRDLVAVIETIVAACRVES